MFKLVHTADWQLGAPNQPVVCQQPLAALISATRNAGANLILCAGDIFHKHSPDQQIKDYLLQTILENQDIFFVFIAGNHDYTTKEKEYTSLNYISLLVKSKKLQNAWVIEPGSHITCEDAVLWNMEEWDDIKNPIPFDRASKFVVAVWHGIVPGLNLKNGVYDSNAKSSCSIAISKNNINYVALGDVHKQCQVNNNCYYCGALTQTSYVDDLGALLVMIYEHVTDVRKLNIDLPKKVSFMLEYNEEHDTEEDIIEFVKSHAEKNNFVKLKFNISVEAFMSINKKYVADQVKDACLSIIFDNEPIMVARNRKNMEDLRSATTIEQEIDVIIETEDFGLDKKEIRKRVLDIILHSEFD